MSDKIKSYKAFNKDWTCRGFQFEVGKEYKNESGALACNYGFHACEYPLDVFNYYAPSESVFAEVEQSGEVSKEGNDTKVASSFISIKAELNIHDLVKAAFGFTYEKCKKLKSSHSVKDRSASSATGDLSASSATGDLSASSATGDQSASSATGDRSASSATGDQSASSATGDQSASLSTGNYSSSEIIDNKEKQNAVAVAAGGSSKARAPKGSAIVCVYRDDEGNLIHIKSSLVGENGIKPNTWYSLDESGSFIEV